MMLLLSGNDMREKLGKGVRHEDISRGRVKGEIIGQQRDFKGNNFIGSAESSLSPLAGLRLPSDGYPALALPQSGIAQTGLKLCWPYGPLI
jgi:hypothetical protein